MGIRETVKGLGGVVGPALVGFAAGVVAWGVVETYDAETRSVVLD